MKTYIVIQIRALPKSASQIEGAPPKYNQTLLKIKNTINNVQIGVRTHQFDVKL